PELSLQSWGWDPESSYDPGNEEDRTWSYANWEWIKWCSQTADGAVPATLNHFWLVADGLHDDPGYGTYNSWEKTYGLWLAAYNAWQTGDLGWAYTNLGYSMHHVQDLLQPAHSNQDLHPADDAIENWFSQDAAIAMYSWDGSTGPAPGPEVPYPDATVQNNAQLLQDIYNAFDDDDVADFPALTNPNLPYNMQKFFYLLYWADQIGNYFASDDEDGASNSDDPTGWMGGYVGFPTALAGGYSIHDWHGLVDNDSDCGGCTPWCRYGECDADGDLTLIANWCYAGAFKVSPALIDLFRMTVDNVPPVTTAEVTRLDGEPVVEWNNSPVTVQLLSAVDYGNPGAARASGMWKVWGLCDGEPPANYDAPSWGISEDGKHTVECMSTDMCGNVEQDQDIAVWIDMTPPEITFPDLRPNYLTSEDFIATWVAVDALSGVDYEYALLDGQQVDKEQVIDLALLAGRHTLEVYANDVAGNIGYAVYEFEVFIDASGWTRPVLSGDKTKGAGLFFAVEFPAPYDVGLIEMSTCTLAVGAGLDLMASDPVVGSLAVLEAEVMTGVGDSNANHIGDRMLRFDKRDFIAALAGQVGDISSVVRGGLLPDGMPHFLAVVTIPVFAPSEK
ncbi:MAG: hypothetical protein MUQ65_01355, partial [Armatimonadetes bacterium]|nr:hypothetical protein [Armatimonadota bacterium]